jgi:hypothetical protein
MNFEDLYNFQTVKPISRYTKLSSCFGHMWKIICYLGTPKSFSGVRDGLVGIAAYYTLDGPGTFSARPMWSQDPPNHPYNGYRMFFGGRNIRGVVLTNSLFAVPKLQMV